MLFLFLAVFGLLNYLKGPEQRLHLYIETIQLELNLQPGENKTIVINDPQELFTYIAFFHIAGLNISRGLNVSSSNVIKYREIDLYINKINGTITIFILNSSECKVLRENRTLTYTDKLDVTSKGVTMKTVIFQESGFFTYPCIVAIAVEQSKAELNISKKVLAYTADYNKAFSWLYVSVASFIVLSLVQITSKLTLEEIYNEIVQRLYKRNKTLSKIGLPPLPPLISYFICFLSIVVIVVPRLGITFYEFPVDSQLEYNVFLDLYTRFIFPCWLLLLPLLILLHVLVLKRILFVPILIKYFSSENIEEYFRGAHEVDEYFKRTFMKNPVAYLYYSSIIISIILIDRMLHINILQIFQLVTLFILIYAIFVQVRRIRIHKEFYSKYFLCHRADYGLLMLSIILYSVIALNINNLVINRAFSLFWEGTPAVAKDEELIALVYEYIQVHGIFIDSVATTLPIIAIALYSTMVVTLFVIIEKSRGSEDFVIRSFIEGCIAVFSIIIEILLEIRYIFDFGLIWSSLQKEILEAIILSLIGGYLYEIKEYIAKMFNITELRSSTEL